MRHSHPLPIAAPRPNADLNPRRDPPLDFPDRDFGELAAGDYQALGFMCGLEVHQQLHTRSKLFCRCPAGVYGERIDAEILRHMRPTLSELGQYDGTALMEFKTRKEIVYRLARGSVCTYEIDDTPPFLIDAEAVRISLEIAKLFGLELVQELHVMRKQYLDGSIPTGFQRTAMVGLHGSIPFQGSELGPGRELRIRQLSLEEDSCREVADEGHRITFRTDRLGMPLVETVTEPDLLTPLDVQRGAGLIAQVARCSGKVRRGLGAARQDVNVSIAGGRRIEIKGVPTHRVLPRLVHTEAFRQLALLRIRAELLRRGLAPELLPDPAPGHAWETSRLAVDARSILRKSEFAPVREAFERGDMICAVRLPRFRRLLAQRTQPGISFARELSERVRVIACLTARPFMIHSDVVDFGFKGSRWNQLRAATRADSGDAIVVVWGPADDVDTAAREVIARAREALDGVPAETRQAYADGTTGFERILPGPDRMYPDTDTPPLPIPDPWVAEIRLGERPWQRIERYQALGLTPAVATRLAAAPWAELLDAIAPPAGIAARRLAFTLERRFSSVRPVLAHAERLRELVLALAERPVLAGAFDELVVEAVAHPEESIDELLAGYAPATDAAEHYGLEPDILTGGKGLSGGVGSLAVTMTSDAVAAGFQGGTTPTSGGNAVSAAAGAALIDVILRERLLDNCTRMGEYMTEAVRRLDDPWVGDIRFLGLLGGVELVLHPGTKEPVPKKSMEAIRVGLLRRGILMTVSGLLGNVLRLQPPLTVRPAHIDALTAALAELLPAVRAASS